MYYWFQQPNFNYIRKDPWTKQVTKRPTLGKEGVQEFDWTLFVTTNSRGLHIGILYTDFKYTIMKEVPQDLTGVPLSLLLLN